MGLTGVTYLDQPAALVMNPANLEGIDKLGFTINFSALLVNQRAPVQGPNTRIESGLGFGPLPSGFIAGRIAPRVVFAGGIYIETGYGSSFDQVTCLDGDVVGGPPDYTPSTPDSTPPCTNPEPQNLDVSFFIGEFSAGFSFRAHEKFLLGLALRLPFSKQTADLYQNIGAALGSSFYGRVKNDLGGMGFPSLRFGFTIKPHRKVRISAMYRMYSKIKLTGTTETALFPGTPPITLDAEADWNIPHAVHFGVSYQANSHLLLAFEARAQFHGAAKSGNLNQTVTATDPAGNLPRHKSSCPSAGRTPGARRSGLSIGSRRTFWRFDWAPTSRTPRRPGSSPSTSRRLRPFHDFHGQRRSRLLLGRPERLEHQRQVQARSRGPLFLHGQDLRQRIHRHRGNYSRHVGHGNPLFG